MKKNKSILALLYLSCSFFLFIFFMCILAATLGYWIGGGKEIFTFISSNVSMYLKVSTSGFLVGFVLWLFDIR
ncbi:hypothetical protein Xenpb_03211 [Xenorhabdus sp. PB62.4]|nr:hypothetical protein [Xenorhabdus sp. PB62.4]